MAYVLRCARQKSSFYQLNSLLKICVMPYGTDVSYLIGVAQVSHDCEQLINIGLPRVLAMPDAIELLIGHPISRHIVW